FWGGKWAGVLLYGVETFLLFAIAFGWLTLKPWAPLFTLIFALFGFFVPFMSYLAGTDLFSSALAPMIFSAIIVFLSFRPSVRNALAYAAAERTAPKTATTGAVSVPARPATPAAPLVRPKGFRADEV
ncbi:MAG: hypothetical protein KC438_11675, partial [Thermomicrobiales bacterium]|nr:hypothetical protein [Thermomicrobiales bacterium]